MQVRRRQSPWKTFFSWTGYALFLGTWLVAGSLWGWISQSKFMRGEVLRMLPGGKPANPYEHQDHLTLLVLGCDKDLTPGGRKVLNQYARSDMMMIAKLDFKKNRISGLSIPRDTLASAPGYRLQKINAFHSIGGPDLAKQAVESIVPVTIDKVVVLNFDAFQEMVNLVGGVEVYIPKRMKYSDKAAKLYIDLKPGKQKLDGYQAMGFVRFRKSDSDFMRTERQRDFMLAFKDAVMHDIWKLPKVVDKAQDALGDSLSTDELSALANFARKVGSDNIKMGLLPTVEAGGYDLKVDEAALVPILREYHLKEDYSSRLTYNQ